MVKLRDYKEIKASKPIYNEMFEVMKKDLEYKEEPDYIHLIVNQLKPVGGPRLVFLYGPAGTGKNVAAQFIAARLGSPLLETQLDMGTERSDLLGTMAPNPDYASDGQMYKYIEEILTIGAKYGLVTAFHEANYAIPSIMSLFNSFTDGSKYFKLNGEWVPIHENFVVMVTLNPGYRDTFPFNPALVSRGLYIPTVQPTKDTMYKWLVRESKKPVVINEADYIEPKLKVKDFPKSVHDTLDEIKTAYYKHANSVSSNVDATFRHMQRAVDMILINPTDVNHIKDSLIYTLFGSMGVNEDLVDNIYTFANTEAMKAKYRTIASTFDLLLSPKPKAVKKAEPEPVKKAEPFDEMDEIDSIIKSATKGIKEMMLDPE
jgi:Cdc6-like AAA superfamily ATPase